jgi:RHS repeat-associated protein
MPYDAFGNRAVTPSSYIPNPTLTPTATTQFTNNRWTGGSSNASYDTGGNQTFNNGTGNAFAYDAENRMVTANMAGTGSVTYVYDGEGRRVQKSWSAGTCTGGTCSTTYVYDAMGDLAAEYSNLTPASPTGTEYLSVDTLGSTRLITNNVGGSPECLDYLPFGEEIPAGENGRPSCYTSGLYPNSPDPDGSRKFTGKERDSETGLDYFGARYFSSVQGRFTGPDAPLADQHPEDPQSWNMYAYVRNNPLKNTDPNGRDCFQGLSSCGDYLIGGLKAAVNVVPNTATLLNRGINFLTGSNIPDAPTLQPSNVDQAQGIEAANVMIAISPVAELGVARSAATAATEVPQITQNALRGAESETRVLNDMGLTKNTTPITGTAGRSIPDINTSTMIGDIKDAKTVSNTPQMQIQREVAGQTGKDHVIVTGTNTHVTGPTQQPPTKIIRRDDLGPKQP